jgi:hypothetical protein
MTTRKVILLLTIFSFLFPTNGLAATDTPREPKPPCRLQISNAHISTYLIEKSGVRAVKVNVSSICNVPQSNVTITIEIWKTGLLGNHFVRRQTIHSSGSTFPGSRVDNLVTFKRCKDRSSTQYFGIAFSKALIAGKWQYARDTRSQFISVLKCGT